MQNVLRDPADNTAASATLTVQAFARLRKDVLDGTFAPGAKLTLDKLQEGYGFSSSPLREALSRLAQEGLVRTDDRRGFWVAPISAADLNDITHMRLLVDVSALRDAIVRGDDAWEAHIVATFHRLEKIEQRFGDGPIVLNDDWSRMHRDFHLALTAACASKRQRLLSESLFDQAERYRRFSARHRQTARRKTNEHRRLMDATLRRDAETAGVMLTEHILGTQRNVEAALAAAKES